MIGQSFGHYQILERIGSGGMGVVYRAHDSQLERTVAIKVIGQNLSADETARARLLREARTASALNHPNVCTIYEVGEVNGQAYIAMEYIEGRPLTALVPLRGLPVESSIRYAVQVADALAHAHERGVVHRDLKSANVIVTPDGRVKCDRGSGSACCAAERLASPVDLGRAGSDCAGRRHPEPARAMDGGSGRTPREHGWDGLQHRGSERVLREGDAVSHGAGRLHAESTVARASTPARPSLCRSAGLERARPSDRQNYQ